MGTFEANLATFVQWLLKATLQGSLLVCLIVLIKVVLRGSSRHAGITPCGSFY